MFYSCSSISDFLGNNIQKKDFYSFLFSEKCNRVVVIVGGSGYGKTTFCENIFRDLECSKRFSFIRPIYEHLSTHKEFIHFIETSINTFNILNLNQRNKLLFLDDVDILFNDVDILFNVDRQASRFILDLVKNLKNVPHLRIVMTCSMSEEKRLSDIKKKGVCIIRLDKPCLDECTKAILNHISELREYKRKDTSQNIRVIVNVHERERIRSLAKVMGCNMRSIITHIDEVVTLYPKNEERNENSHLSLHKEGYSEENNKIQNYAYHMTNSLYTNMNVLDLAENIMRNSHRGVLDLVIPLSSDPNLISMILYENLLPFLMKNYTFEKDILLFGLKRIHEAFIAGSVIETGVYKNASWDVFNLDWIHLYNV